MPSGLLRRNVLFSDSPPKIALLRRLLPRRSLIPRRAPIKLGPNRSTGDAWLADVCFVDAQCGWAVGDRGVIWHTEDGGRQWRLQPSGAACTLQSVCFINRKIGWAAGGSGPTLFTHRQRRAAYDPRRRSNLDRQSPPAFARVEKNPFLRSRTRLGDRFSLGDVSLGRIRIRRRRPKLASAGRKRRFAPG